MSLLKIEKPDLSKIIGQKPIELFTKNREIFRAFLDKADSPAYLPWSKVKYKQTPPGLSPVEYWYLIKLTRGFRATPTFIQAENGSVFTWGKLDRFDRFMHQFDLETGGNLMVPAERLSLLNTGKENFVARGIMEEAIASSQLEGAHTTRKVAKQMILERRKPRNASEQMILNNYRTMQAIADDFKNRPLSREVLFELHAMLVDGTDVPEEEKRRFRTDMDNIVVGDDQNNIGHIPPKEEFLNKELDRFINIANDMSDDEIFLHPLVKAIFLHFWTGYLHPFTDGNGRLARTIFYWYLLKKGYWAALYLPISVMLKRSPSQYKHAYLYAEQDDYDLTYFVDYNFAKIAMAIAEFREYVAGKMQENKKINRTLASKYGLNDRQKQVLFHLARASGEHATIASHQVLNRISRITATKDLGGLVNLKLLSQKKEGKTFFYTATEQARKLFSLTA